MSEKAVHSPTTYPPNTFQVQYREYSPIYTTGNFWHGSDKNGTRTKNYSTDVLFTRLFFCRAKRREKMFWYG